MASAVMHAIRMSHVTVVMVPAVVTATHMYMLLVWLGVIFLPLMTTGANGEPDATTARPSVHVYACSAVHSAWEVGLDSGKMMGRST